MANKFHHIVNAKQFQYDAMGARFGMNYADFTPITQTATKFKYTYMYQGAKVTVIEKGDFVYNGSIFAMVNFESRIIKVKEGGVTTTTTVDTVDTKIPLTDIMNVKWKADYAGSTFMDPQSSGNLADFVSLSDAANSFNGGFGDDTIYGLGGNDRLWGENGKDKLWGDAGKDDLYGEKGNDMLWGGAGKDFLYGGTGKDYLNGGADNDMLWGESGNDKLWGGAGRDKLWGESGNDKLWGGAGRDSLAGGTGNDKLWGGAGKDKYYFADKDGQDLVKDFENNKDTIYLGDNLWTGTKSVGNVLNQFGSVNGSDYVLDFGGGDILIIQNTTRSQLFNDIIIDEL